MKNGLLLLGHVLKLLRCFPDGFFSTCVTSPPYWGLRDYGIEAVIWDDPGGCEHVWGNESFISNTAPRDHDGANGFSETRGTEKSRSGTTLSASQGQFCQHCNAWRGSLGLEPTPELFVQHIVEIFREVRRVLRDDGTLWLNLGDSYAANIGAKNKHNANTKEGTPGYVPNAWNARNATPVKHPTKPKDLVGIPWMVAFALRSDGWYLRSDIIWHKPNPMPESVTDRPTKAHEYMFLLTKSAKYFYDADAIREPNTPGTIARVKSGPVQSPGAPGHKAALIKRWAGQGEYSETNGRNKRTVWTIPTQPYKAAHFATFPELLIEPCILAGCPPDGIVLDPFGGSGTTAVVANYHKRDWIIMDASAEYLDLADERIALGSKTLAKRDATP